MKLSRKLEYACRVLAQLGRFYGGGQLAHIEDLARLEAVPQNYLVQILNELRMGGLLDSRRGKQGGYMLAKAPAEISLRDIVDIIEPGMLSPATNPEGQSGAQISEVWNSIGKKLRKDLQQTSLAIMIPRYNAGALYDI
ncbi:MAG: Rrf2 family transcriptional regulator [Puniceicoccales bacterium]|jgi:Rrf2 family protein|nr:Rrf2 family transcriptional regulator [Puniceicoccales bacterium]